MKHCTKCGKTKPLGDFHKDRRRPDGVRSSCKDCNKDAERLYKQAHRIQSREHEKRYIERHKNEIRERARAKYSEIAEKVRERVRRWYADHPEKNSAKKENRRARMYGSGKTVTTKEWKSVLDKYGCRCLYPGCERTDLTMDHVIPLSLGGTHAIDNIQPLCSFHNSSKGTKAIDYR